MVCSFCNELDEKNNDFICNEGNHPCGKCTHVFKRHAGTKDNIVMQFIKWVLALHKKKKCTEINIISHNGARFDNFIVFSQLLDMSEELEISPPVRRGNAVLSLTIENNIHFKDSYLYLMMGLKKLSKTFGFENYVRKGLLPYKVLTQDNLDYCGPCPDISKFDLTKLTPNEIDEVHDYIGSFNNNERPYNLMNECISYCVSDVMILRLSFEHYRRVYIKDYKIDPLKSACTVASLCFKIFQPKFLKKNTIPIIDRHRAKCHSFTGITLVCYIGSILNVEVRHARSTESELPIKINGQLFYCDGSFKCPTTNETVILSFHGCYYHGCHTCIREGRIKETFRDGISCIDLYNKTSRDDNLKSQNYKHIVIWECQYHKLRSSGGESNYISGYDEIDKNNTFWDGLNDYVKTYGPVIRNKPLSLDDALAGGRTNPVRLYVNIRDTPDQTIVYKDICSLYPFIQLGGFDFPVGPPIKRIAHEVPSATDFTKELIDGTFFGIVRVDVLPPQNLALPVLYIKLNHKLAFPLCKECARIADHDKDCNHDENQRMLDNTYSSVELKLAVDKKYKIVNVYET